LYLSEIKVFKGAMFVESDIDTVYAPNLEQINENNCFPSFLESGIKTIFCNENV
jgi:hypothetical protein